MKIIGITGNSGSGKSTICAKLNEYLHANILDADKIAKKICFKNSQYLREIVQEFGQVVLLENGELNRKALSDIIYNNFSAKKKLDKITFKHVCGKIVEEIKENSLKENIEYIIIDAPLLFEAELDKICNLVISVIAKKDQKIARICKRDNISKEIAEKRLEIQQEDSYYISKSDFVIENNDENNIDEKIEEICNKITNIKN